LRRTTIANLTVGEDFEADFPASTLGISIATACFVSSIQGQHTCTAKLAFVGFGAIFEANSRAVSGIDFQAEHAFFAGQFIAACLASIADGLGLANGGPSGIFALKVSGTTRRSLFGSTSTTTTLSKDALVTGGATTTLVVVLAGTEVLSTKLVTTTSRPTACVTGARFEADIASIL
jgi:hypothetical protein